MRLTQDIVNISYKKTMMSRSLTVDLVFSFLFYFLFIFFSFSFSFSIFRTRVRVEVTNHTSVTSDDVVTKTHDA